ncbi:caspase family protein [Amycolatopsis sp. GM8]|uniref:HD domain-containing protein n=1 Tax=Amycolatopsis sp. GM8 TaxID=2896530 RepID=UPI001F15BAE7|nr:caspase family protein [Amycolatopsis sp. GM8]
MNRSPFRALLIGVPHYRDESIADLPFVDDDLDELAHALEEAGYEVDLNAPDETDLSLLQYRVEKFVENAAPGQTLLIYLSGHGIHQQGMDYLVPAGAMTDAHDFAGMCLPIDFDKYVENSAASSVVTFVDACREGITTPAKSVAVQGWTKRQVAHVAAQRIAYLYACSPGERAGYSSDGFSVLSRALSTVLQQRLRTGSLADVMPALQREVDSLTREQQLRRQNLRLLTEVDRDELVLVPAPARHPAGHGHEWSALAREHTAWTLVADRPGVEELRDATVDLVEQLAARIPDMSEDPWYEHGFAARTTVRTQWLVSKVLDPATVGLRAAEAALLVALPFLHEYYWLTVAAGAWTAVRDGEGSQAEQFSRFVAGHPRLHRRLESGDGAEEIRWWLFHRWLVTRPDSHLGHEDLLSFELNGLAAEVFDPRHLAALVCSVRMDTTVLVSSDRENSLCERRLVASSLDLEQEVRERLIALVIATAYRFAIAPASLPDVVADHLGIVHSIDLPALHATVAAATWEKRGRSRVLKARCQHQAVGQALTEHASSVDEFLGQVDALADRYEALKPLAGLPTGANADLVRGAPGAYDGAFRFRLADDRVQELLTGEQLYGDATLAVRELYQNALDACRYRRARLAFLRSTGAAPQPWKGRISFRQGVDEQGRPYLDCVDNGIGMGLRELVDVFSYAGVRFHDLPEYIEEHAQWREAGIELFPNSRFGIGVLSYFMLADEISISTCRLDRKGRPGRRLSVSIAGPGTLFKVQDQGRGEEAGTRVRLHLRMGVGQFSCADVLRRILWISDFDVEARGVTGELGYGAGDLSDDAPIGANDPLAPTPSDWSSGWCRPATRRSGGATAKVACSRTESGQGVRSTVSWSI